MGGLHGWLLAGGDMIEDLPSLSRSSGSGASLTHKTGYNDSFYFSCLWTPVSGIPLYHSDNDQLYIPFYPRSR